MGLRRWFACNSGRVAYVFLALVIAGSDAAYIHHDGQVRAQRRHDNCLSIQHQYDGQIKLASFIGAQLRASPKQIEDGLNQLRGVLGPRPDC